MFFHNVTLLYLRQTQASVSKLIRSVSTYNKIKRIVYLTAEKHENLLTKSNISTETWEKIKADMIESQVPPTALDTYILHLCFCQKLVEPGLSYYYELLKNNKKPSVVTTSEFLLLFSLKVDPLTDAEKKIIWKIYTEISKEYSSFDYNLANACAIALCKADYVQESIKVLNQFEELNPKEILFDASNELAIYFLKEGDLELAFKYIILCCLKSVGPNNNTYIAYLKYCSQNSQTFDANIERLFTVFKEYGVIPPINVISDYMTVCNKYGWSAQMTVLNKSICNRCKHPAVNSSLTTAEFDILRKHAMNKLLFKDCYKISSPYELKNFVCFMDTTGPYDVIIDGLNMYYRGGAEDISLVVDYLYSIKKKPLIIGKSHMAKMTLIQKLMRTTHFYFLKDVSKDDQFILYATLASGKDCIFISGDYMRQHKFALSDERVAILFKKWQHLHQYTYQIDINMQVRLPLLSGSVYDPNHNINSGVEKNGDFWHIPCMLKWGRIRPNNPKDWACFRIPNRTQE